MRGEYTYAKVDKDATLAAYGADDFFWVTGWKGHRIDLGGRIRDQVSLHVVGQLQKFKDSPRPAEARPLEPPHPGRAALRVRPALAAGRGFRMPQRHRDTEKRKQRNGYRGGRPFDATETEGDLRELLG